MTFLDPVMISTQKHEAEMRLPFVFPEEFYIKYKEQQDGSQKSEDWVLVTKKGMQNPQRTPMRWRDVERSPDLLAVLKPFYDNWKHGQSTPVSGTPLEAWIADASLVKVLQSVNVRSVEDLVAVEDHFLTKLNIPSIREKQKRAKAFLEAQKSTAKVSEEIVQLQSRLDDRDREIKELRALIEQHVSKKETPVASEIVPVRRGPGRPRKIVQELPT